MICWNRWYHIHDIMSDITGVWSHMSTLWYHSFETVYSYYDIIYMISYVWYHIAEKSIWNHIWYRDSISYDIIVFVIWYHMSTYDIIYIWYHRYMISYMKYINDMVHDVIWRHYDIICQYMKSSTYDFIGYQESRCRTIMIIIESARCDRTSRSAVRHCEQKCLLFPELSSLVSARFILSLSKADDLSFPARLQPSRTVAEDEATDDWTSWSKF